MYQENCKMTYRSIFSCIGCAYECMCLCSVFIYTLSVILMYPALHGGYSQPHFTNEETVLQGQTTSLRAFS